MIKKVDDADLARERSAESVCGCFRGQIPAGTGITIKVIYTETRYSRYFYIDRLKVLT